LTINKSLTLIITNRSEVQTHSVLFMKSLFNNVTTPPEGLPKSGPHIEHDQAWLICQMLGNLGNRIETYSFAGVSQCSCSRMKSAAIISNYSANLYRLCPPSEFRDDV